MPYPLKATDAEVAEAYAQHGTCSGAAKALGMGKQSVQERLVKLGIARQRPKFSDSEKAVLIAEYERFVADGRLDELAEKMGRTRQFLCRMAKALDLTDQSRDRPFLADQMSARSKEWHQNNPHPCGMQGKRHTAETIELVSKAGEARWAAMTADQRSELTLSQMKAKSAKGPNTRARNATWKAGWREVGDRRIFFRSRWEANYGRYLEWLKSTGNIAEWEHEPETFWFEAIKRGVRSYLPDFRVTENSGSVIYHEVKGWMDDRSRVCIKRMRIYHPKVRLLVIDAKAYRSIAKKVSSIVPDWEVEGKAATEAK